MGSSLASLPGGRADSSFLDELSKVRLNWGINADDVSKAGVKSREYLFQMHVTLLNSV
jgi:hypothetical protein